MFKKELTIKFIALFFSCYMIYSEVIFVIPYVIDIIHNNAICSVGHIINPVIKILLAISAILIVFNKTRNRYWILPCIIIALTVVNLTNSILNTVHKLEFYSFLSTDELTNYFCTAFSSIILMIGNVLLCLFLMNLFRRRLVGLTIIVVSLITQFMLWVIFTDQNLMDVLLKNIMNYLKWLVVTGYIYYGRPYAESG